MIKDEFKLIKGDYYYVTICQSIYTHCGIMGMMNLKDDIYIWLNKEVEFGEI